MSILAYIAKTFGSAVIAYTSHYAVTKFYTYACVPDGFYGYLQGYITTGSPVCQASLQLITNTQMSYSNTVMIILSRAIMDVLAPGATKANV